MKWNDNKSSDKGANTNRQKIKKSEWKKKDRMEENPLHLFCLHKQMG